MINFPSNPNVDDVFGHWKYDGNAWKRQWNLLKGLSGNSLAIPNIEPFKIITSVDNQYTFFFNEDGEVLADFRFENPTSSTWEVLLDNTQIAAGDFMSMSIDGVRKNIELVQTKLFIKNITKGSALKILGKFGSVSIDGVMYYK